jgi:hypothetical protein
MCCRGLQGLANAPYLSRFPFSALPCVAPCCAPGGVRVVSDRVGITARGAHPRLVRELLGHISVTMTIDLYTHVLPSMGEQTALAMDAVLS